MPASYFPLDVNFFDHPKVVGRSDAALRLHLSAIGYANRLMTDGHIARQVPGRLVEWDSNDPDAATPNALAAELVDAVLWHPADAPCPRGHDDICPKLAGDGWRIHDFLEHNRSREKRLEEQQAERDRKAAWRARQKAATGDGRVPRESRVAGTRDKTRDTSITGTRDGRLGPPVETEIEIETRTTTHPEDVQPPSGFPQGPVENLRSQGHEPRRARLVDPQPIGGAVAAIAEGQAPPAPTAEQRRWREERDKRAAAETLLAEGGAA